MKQLFCILQIFLLSGCMLTTPLTPSDMKGLTPEQIKAYNESGSAVYGCLTVGGPPIGGGSTILIVPKDAAQGDIQFAPNCQLQAGKVTLGGTALEQEIKITVPTPKLSLTPVPTSTLK